MKRVLFVDDESRILDGLRRMLRAQRHEWEMSFAPGGEAALAEMQRTTFDVVVSDMRMPGLDGFELLSRVQQIDPGTLRIILSGHTDPALAAMAARVAHQFHFKPTSPDALRAVVERGCALAATVPTEMRRMVGEIGAFPVAESSYRALLEALDQPDCPIEALTRIAEGDIGIAGKLLQVVNSSFFGISPEVAAIGAAVRLLGVGTIRELACTAGIFRPVSEFRGSCPVPGIQGDGAAGGRGERHAAALLQDIGRLVLRDARPEAYAEMLLEAETTGDPLHELEMRRFGTTDAHLTVYLLGIWNLPASIVEEIANRHGRALALASAPISAR